MRKNASTLHRWLICRTVGLDCARYATPQRSAAEVRRELRIPEDATVLLSVGTLRMQKRLRIVLQAMTRLRELDQLHYIICGEGPDMPFLRKLTEKLHLTERVHLLGYRTGHSGSAGGSGHLLHAVPPGGLRHGGAGGNGCRSALIVTRVHGTKTYAEAGESACCLKGDLVLACADAIQQLCDNKLLRKQMGAHNRADAVRFSGEGRMMQMRELYRQAMDQ